MATSCDRCNVRNSEDRKVIKLNKIRIANFIQTIDKDICSVCLDFFSKEVNDFF